MLACWSISVLADSLIAVEIFSSGPNWWMDDQHNPQSCSLKMLNIYLMLHYIVQLVVNSQHVETLVFLHVTFIL